MALRLDQKIKLMTALPLFQKMEPEAVHVLAFSTRERPIHAGDTLFSEGDGSDGGFLLVQGAIVLRSGRQEKEITPGMLIGETALISATKRPATAHVTADGSVLVLPRMLVLQVLEAHPQSAVHLREHIAASLAETRKALRQIAL